MERKIEMSKEALADLAAQASLEVKGVTACQQNPVEIITSRVKREFTHHGVMVEEEDGSYNLRVHLSVAFGEKIPRIAKEVRERVREYVEATAGVKVNRVEVVIEDIDFPGVR
jgi:uncharacterized alkaline shock family protein YloU